MRVDLGVALEGFFFEKVNGSMGQRVKRYFFGADTPLQNAHGVLQQKAHSVLRVYSLDGYIY